MCQYTMYCDQIELNAQLQDMIKQEPEKGGPDNHHKEQYLVQHGEFSGRKFTLACIAPTVKAKRTERLQGYRKSTCLTSKAHSMHI